MAWQNLAGWSEDIQRFYPYLAERIPQGGVFVEVGVFLGRSISLMHSLRPDLEIYGCDPWAADYRYLQGLDIVDLGGLPEDADVLTRMPFYDAFEYLMCKHVPETYKHVTWLRGTYPEVTHPLADAIFIDGDHTGESITKDLTQAYKLAKPGAIICGHDGPYYRNKKPDPSFKQNPLFPDLVRGIKDYADRHNKRMRMAPSDESWTTAWYLEDL